MDVAKYAVGPESYDNLSRHQVSEFFSANTSCTLEQCNDLAAKLLGGPVSATPIQEGGSYTVEAEGAIQVVQFRSRPLDIAQFEQIQQIYRNFVPRCQYHDTLASLHVYLWDRVPEPAFCRIRRHMFKLNIGMEERLEQAVEDCAKFFALGWTNRPASQPQAPGLQDQYAAILDKLSPTLPQSLQSTLAKVNKNLHLIFRPDFPMVLQPSDLYEMNVHVNESTGHITGIMDWRGDFVAPFGLSLGGAEIFLGVRTSTEWFFHPSHVEMRQHFWSTLYSEIGEVSDLDKQSIEIARVMGLFLRHSFEQTNKSAVYLERLILDVEHA